MIKLKKLIKEAHAWERKFGEPLPTLASVQKKKLKEDLLTEKKELDSQFITQIHLLTNRNNHTEARRKLSSWMGNDKLMSFYEAMGTLNKVFNGFPPELSKLNQKMEKELYKQLNRSYKNYDAIYDAL